MEIKSMEGKEVKGFKPDPDVARLMELAEKRPWLEELGIDFHTSPEELERLVANSQTLERLDEVARAAAPSVEKEQPGLLSFLARFKGLLPLTMSAGILLSPACKAPSPEELAERKTKEEQADKFSQEGIKVSVRNAGAALEHLDALRAYKASHPEVDQIIIEQFEQDGSDLFISVWVYSDHGEGLRGSPAYNRWDSTKISSDDALARTLDDAMHRNKMGGFSRVFTDSKTTEDQQK